MIKVSKIGSKIEVKPRAEQEVSPTPAMYNSLYNFEFLALTETKLKRNGKVSCFGVNGIIAGVQEMERAWGRVAVLLNDV